MGARTGEAEGGLDDVVSYAPALRAFFARKSRRFDPDDLLQDLFMRVHQRRLARRDGAEVRNVEGYLFRVAASVLTDAHRRSAVRGHHAATPLSEGHPYEDVPADRVLEDRERLSLVLSALNELPERTRSVFALVRFEEMSYGGVARRYGVSVSAVEKHVMNATRHLAKRLQESYADVAANARG